MSMVESGTSAGIWCAVLAGGRSERLGQPKQLVTIAGVPLVRRIAHVVLEAGFARCAIVLGCYAIEVEQALMGLPLELLPNPEWEEGMAASIRRAARWAEGSAGLVLATCDQWRLSAEHLGRLRTAIAGPEDLAASHYENGTGVPAAFGSAWLGRLSGLSGGRGAGKLLAAAGSVQRIPWPEGADDLDTEADLARARALA